MNAKGKDGWTPLHWASVVGVENSFPISLLKNNANVHAKGKDGDIPFDDIPFNVFVTPSADKIKETVSILLQNNANVDAKTKKDETPLHMASATGKTTVVLILLQNKAYVNAKTTYGLIPLDFASQAGKANIVSILLKNKSNVGNYILNLSKPKH